MHIVYGESSSRFAVMGNCIIVSPIIFVFYTTP